MPRLGVLEVVLEEAAEISRPRTELETRLGESHHAEAERQEQAAAAGVDERPRDRRRIQQSDRGDEHAEQHDGGADDSDGLVVDVLERPLLGVNDGARLLVGDADAAGVPLGVRTGLHATSGLSRFRG